MEERLLHRRRWPRHAVAPGSQTRAAWGVSVVVTTAAITLLLLVVLREALDQRALGEVVPVGPVDLAPLAGSQLCRGRLWGPPVGFLPVGGLLRPSIASAATAFRLFFLFPCLLRSREVGSSGALHHSVRL
jgi:hypothetical protein